MSMAARLALLFSGAALWLATNLYWGIWHDARLYSLMAMRRLMPNAYEAEPWFLFGAQDGASIFPALFAQVVASVGLGEAARGTALAGGMVFVGAAFAFSRAARLGQYSALAFLLLVSFPLAYCPNDWMITRLSESFVTARPFAIAASLAALAAHLRGRQVAGWVLHGLALWLHPLMAVGAAAVSLGARMSDRAVLAGVMFAPVLMLALILFDVPPLRAMGAIWFDLVAQTAVIVVMPGEHHDASLIAAAAAVLVLAAMYGRPALGRWYVLAVIVGFLGYVATLAASRFHPAALILQVQPWRALWLTMVFAVVALSDLVSGWRNASSMGRLGLLAGGSLLLLFELGGGYVLLISAIVLRVADTAVMACLGRLSLTLLRRSVWLVFLVSAGTELALLSAVFGLAGGGSPVAEPVLPDIARGFLLTGGFGLLAVAVLTALRSVPANIGLGLAIVAFSAALAFWDQRSIFVIELEGRYRAASAPEHFSGKIRQGDVVYWQGSPERVWFELRTASYAGSVQAVGIVFSERLALEMQRRLGRVAQIGVPDELFADSRVSDADRLGHALAHKGLQWPENLHAWDASGSLEQDDLTPTSLHYLCADPALDWVINSAVLSGLESSIAPLPMRRGQKDHALYDCHKLRREGSA
jgi:hypothetical protein